MEESNKNAAEPDLIISEGHVAMLKKRLGTLPIQSPSAQLQDGKQRHVDYLPASVCTTVTETAIAPVEKSRRIKSLLQIALDRYWEYKGAHGTMDDLNILLDNKSGACTRQLLRYLIENHQSLENKDSANLIFLHLKNTLLTQTYLKNPNGIYPSIEAQELLLSSHITDVERLWLETLSPVMKLNKDILLAIKCIFDESWKTKGDSMFGKKTPTTISDCKWLVFRAHGYHHEFDLPNFSYKVNKENFRFEYTDSQAKTLMCELYSQVNKKTDPKYDSLKKLLYNTFPEKPETLDQCVKLVEQKLFESEFKKSQIRGDHLRK